MLQRDQTFSKHSDGEFIFHVSDGIEASSLACWGVSEVSSDCDISSWDSDSEASTSSCFKVFPTKASETGSLGLSGSDKSTSSSFASFATIVQLRRLFRKDLHWVRKTRRIPQHQDGGVIRIQYHDTRYCISNSSLYCHALILSLAENFFEKYRLQITNFASITSDPFSV